jgi:hypothetical protein
MHFYGVDVYGENGIDAGLFQLENFIHLAESIQGGNGHPVLLVTETNTPLPATGTLDVYSESGGSEGGGLVYSTIGSDLGNGQPVTVQAISGTLPSPLTEGTTYYMLNVNKPGPGDFQLSTTSFGDPITYGSTGKGHQLTTAPAPRSGDVGNGWFSSVCARMHDYGPESTKVLTYWNVGAAAPEGLSGPFDPNDTDTINSLLHCADDIFNPSNTNDYTNQLPDCTAYPCMP